MSKVWYGNVHNRIGERQKGKLPEVGDFVTEYMWSDREVYEITKVVNENNFFMRRMDAKNKGGYGSNDWELVSNPNGYEYEMVFRYGKWYYKMTLTKELVEKRIKEDGYVLLDDKNYEKVMSKGVVYKYSEKKIVIGVSDYYYDYEFQEDLW